MNPIKIPVEGGRKWKNMLLTMGYCAVMTLSAIAIMIWMGCKDFNIISNLVVLMTAIAVGGGGGAYVAGNVGEHKAKATTTQAFKAFTSSGQ